MIGLGLILFCVGLVVFSIICGLGDSLEVFLVVNTILFFVMIGLCIWLSTLLFVVPIILIVILGVIALMILD